MTTYNPDNWVILKFTSDDSAPDYRILAGWSGGYLDPDSWRMNSGITKVEEDGDYYLFHGSTASVYRCHKKSERLRMNNSYVYESFKKEKGDKMNIIGYDDFIKEFK